MRKLMAALALPLLASILPAGEASATHSPGKGPNYDFVVGSMKYKEVYICGPPLNIEGCEPGDEYVAWQSHVTINARSGPSGENPQGHWSIDSRPFEPNRVFGDVTCLRVDGNRAIIGGRYDERSPTLGHDAAGVLWEVVDLGTGKDDDASNAFVAFVTEESLQSCELPFEIAVPNQQGNFVVHDATP